MLQHVLVCRGTGQRQQRFITIATTEHRVAPRHVTKAYGGRICYHVLVQVASYSAVRILGTMLVISLPTFDYTWISCCKLQHLYAELCDVSF